MTNWEDAEQIEVVLHLKSKYPAVRFTISPVSLINNKVGGSRAQRLGYSAGTPDLMIFEPRGGRHGLFIEMKAPARPYVARTGKLTKTRAGTASLEQLGWINDMRILGYAAHVCVGGPAAKLVIDEYMKGEVEGSI